MVAADKSLLPDTWWIHMDNDRAVKYYEAATLIRELRLMSLERQAGEAIAAIKYAEGCSEGEGVIRLLTQRYMDLQKQKQHLQTEAGRLEFIDGMLESAYEREKQERQLQNATDFTSAAGVQRPGDEVRGEPSGVSDAAGSSNR